MKILKVVMAAVVLLFMPVYAFSANPGWMRISLMEGDVQVKTPDAGDWGLASINGPIMEGDQVWVPEGGRVELQLNSGTYIRLDQNSALQILSMDRDSSQFYLSQGHAYVYFNAPRGGVIQIDTPDGSTRAFDRAVFRIDMSDQYQYTDVAVYRGYVEMENQVGRTRINAGEMLSIGQNTNGEIAQMGPPDEWEGWNKTRNDRIFARRGVSSRYLPPELGTYANDFDTSGRWVEVPDYGYCWTPTIAVGASWAPYRSGRWIWSGGDYVWISYDSWGWAPYHYGRWAFIANIGWCWVPPVAGDVYWGPGYVGWVMTGDYVSWVPLAPGEIYYGRGFYGRNSVNITNININRVNITNVYKNVYVTNGATVVSRNTFATASPKIVSVNQNVIQRQIFSKNNLSAATPAVRIKPTKQSFFMSAKPVPSAKLPPQPVRNIQVPQLKQSRPLIKDQSKSVLNPGAKPKQLPVTSITTPRTPGKALPSVKPLQPAVQGKPGVPKGLERKPLGPVTTPMPGGERRLERKPAGPAVAPTPPITPKGLERKPITPSATPHVPGGERRLERKPLAPTGTPTVPGGLERKRTTPPGAPLPPGEPKGLERKPIAPPTATPPSGGEQRLERKPIGPAVRPTPPSEPKRLERKPITPPTATPPSGGERRLERKPIGPGAPVPQGKKPTATPEGPEKGQKKEKTE
jgi:hypothetical protein